MNVDNNNNNAVNGYCCTYRLDACPNIGTYRYGWEEKRSDFSEYLILEYLQTSNDNLLDLSKRGIVNILLYSHDHIINCPIISI